MINYKKNNLVLPIVKWVGGKRQLLEDINNVLPRSFNTYFEPFLGGGAVLFNLQPKKAIVNDLNKELINTYNVVKNNVEELIINLSKHKNESAYFYNLRDIDRTNNFKELSNIDKASRFIYLNKTCYNGLYRVNSLGEFNTPYGNYKNPNIVNAPTLKAVSEFLNCNDIKFYSCDFEQILNMTKKGDFVYLDPPYDPISETSNFTGYNESGFNRDSQLRLKIMCDELDKRGVKFLLSNSATEFILNLYGDNHNYTIKQISAKRYINCQANKRGSVKEVLVYNYGDKN